MTGILTWLEQAVTGFRWPA